MQVEKPYRAGHDSEGKHRVLGPGDGLSYYSGTLWPHLACATKEECERMATIANTAYEQGYERAQRDIQKSLGIK